MEDFQNPSHLFTRDHQQLKDVTDFENRPHRKKHL